MRYLFSLLLVVLLGTSTFAGENITYSVDGQSYEGYFIKTKPGAPLVLLIHDWDGLTDYEVKRAQMLADLGYSVFAADLFGAGVRPTKIEDKKQHTGELYKDRQKMRKLLNGALNTAKVQNLNTEDAVVAGYCFGGAAVLEFARSGANLKGFVTFHGGLVTPEGQDYSSAKGKFLILHGSADTAITMDDFAALAKELEKNQVQHEMISYSGAPHAFTVFGSKRYREDADKKSWQRFTEYLGETL
ncbi:MAG: dienelactone hydrolase family protein [Desulfobulbaceae bacterium]|nr:dienelactone hydrolase family protein [Desulfobulbaceae bacterium]